MELLATDLVILNHGQVTRTTPELALPLLTTTPQQWEDVSALDRFSVHRCPTRRVFSGTELELTHDVPAMIRYFNHWALFKSFSNNASIKRRMRYCRQHFYATYFSSTLVVVGVSIYHCVSAPRRNGGQ
ncbi:uncharacterized protein TNCV_4881001 [Trichonephila clavipes]|nr:uncharacterized protein TNCV_4881001 [Trichonephila clavipes]